ncbi:cell division ATP-binding protein FtsE [Desulfurivibrio sp. C05AmB]|jgi:cell division transport system ATP-binding protein|uniref:cell division ATP-binding protein FtsE n=1 Tax=Desulfurivibrio sp. C05AmB TaxID=3374371 RepID=UPI00376EEB77
MANLAPPTATMVECIKLGKIYPPDVEAVQEVSLAAARGEILFVTGNSGAGKSTLLKLICRQEIPDAGMVIIGGRDIARLGAAQLQRLRRRIGVAYQDFRLLPQLSVLRNVALAMEIDYRPERKIRRRVEELLAKLDLADKLERPVSELSRGEQQRVAIARAAANSPALLLADEPTGNLDEESAALVLALFGELAAAGGTVIAATHDERLYRADGHRVLHLDRGRLVATVGAR